MELQELKNIWREYDKKLDKNMKLNLHILKKMNLDKTKSALEKFIKTPALGLIIGIIVQIAMGSFIYSHFSMPQYVIPAVLIWSFALFQVIFSGYQLSIILPIEQGGAINYDMPITEIQKKLERLKVYRIRYLTVTRFSYGLLWLPVLIVGCKAFFNYDFYLHFNHTWIVCVILCGLVFTTFGIWLSIKLSDRKKTSPLLKKWMNHFYKNDITAKNLYSAMTFLSDIEDFEKEE
ncbi:MAG: hypothetical protein ACE5IR_18935 [bacterium]